jgi:hypothetical protein
MVRDFQPATSISSFSLPTFGQPAGGEGVPELMGVHGREASGPGSIVDHLVDARRRHGPVAADP